MVACHLDPLGAALPVQADPRLLIGAVRPLPPSPRVQSRLPVVVSSAEPAGFSVWWLFSSSVVGMCPISLPVLTGRLLAAAET